MNREVHVRFCEGVGVKFPRATRPLIHTSGRSHLIDIGRPSRAFPVTPPCIRVRTRRFGRLSD